jgi:hypothetical protein
MVERTEGPVLHTVWLYALSKHSVGGYLGLESSEKSQLRDLKVTVEGLVRLLASNSPRVRNTTP